MGNQSAECADWEVLTNKNFPHLESSRRLITSASGTLHACTMSAVAVSTTVMTPRAPATNACLPWIEKEKCQYCIGKQSLDLGKTQDVRTDFEKIACPGDFTTFVSPCSPLVGMRHTSDGTSSVPGICGSGVLFRPRFSANVAGESSEGATSASEFCFRKKKVSVLYWAMYGQTVTS